LSTVPAPACTPVVSSSANPFQQQLRGRARPKREMKAQSRWQTSSMPWSHSQCSHAYSHAYNFPVRPALTTHTHTHTRTHTDTHTHTHTHTHTEADRGREGERQTYTHMCARMHRGTQTNGRPALPNHPPPPRRYCHAPHAGPIVALARSPFIDGLVASVGDWCFKLWLGDAQTPLFSSPFAEEVYTAGDCVHRFHLQRPFPLCTSRGLRPAAPQASQQARHFEGRLRAAIARKRRLREAPPSGESAAPRLRRASLDALIRVSACMHMCMRAHTHTHTHTHTPPPRSLLEPDATGPAAPGGCCRRAAFVGPP
jgi:hypothetical protein